MAICEATNYYHGSMKYLPVGFYLTPNPIYEELWGHTSFYKALEAHRPKKFRAHQDSVFICENDEDIGLTGGGEKYLFIVEPKGILHRHDLNYGSLVSFLIDEEYSIYSQEVKDACYNYWHGIPSNEPIWELTADSAIILSVEKY